MFSRPIRHIIALLLVFIVVSSFILPLHRQTAYSQDPTTSQRVESDDARVDRNGNWSSQSASGASGGSYLYGGGGENDSLILHFYGASVEVIYVSGPKLGTLAIEVDDTVLRTVITAADTTSYGQSAKINYLSAEWHTLRVYAQEGGTVAIDAFVANLDAPPPTFVEPSDNPDRPAGSAAGVRAPVVETPVMEDTTHHGPRVAELGHVIINEIDANSPDAVELFNPTTSVVNLTGWQILIFSGASLESTWTIPAFYLVPGAYVVVYETAGTNTSAALYMNNSTGMESDFNYAVALNNNLGQGVDFVRWGGSTILPSAPDTWSGSPTFVFDSARSIGRNEQNDDDNSSSDFFQQCPTLGKVNNACLVLNEFFTDVVDAVEIFNPTGRTISLTGYQFTSYSGVNTLDLTYTFPTASIPSGGYVVLYEGAGTNTSTVFYAGSGQNFAWNADDGAGLLTTGAGGSVVDFARWGTTTVAPAGTSWFGGVLPTGPNDNTSVQRRPSGEDGDRTSDFCVQVPTLGTLNRPCVVINEIYGSDPDGIEIYNASLAAYTLTGFNVQLYDYTGTLGVDFNIPTFTLAAGAYVRVVEGAGTNTSTLLFGGGSLGWISGDPGAARLYNESSNGVDFVRWGNNTELGINGAFMLSPNAPAFPGNVSTTSIGRNTSGGDTDRGSDWCHQPTSPSTRNYGCPARLAVFAPASNQVSLTETPGSPPPPGNYFTYNSGLPAAGTNGQWVMGDWDGDGRQTPGVYGTNGVFYFTNAIGPIPSTAWLGIWFGLLAGVVPNAPIAGRFNSAVQNDCIGVTDSANFPPYGVAFVLYFTCDMTGGNPPKTFQWLSVVLPDNQGFTGTFQFGAGDYDNNAVDSVAIRRGNFIAFTNTNPTTTNATFALAQYFEPPIAGTSLFIVGDFDNNGLDSFGYFFPASGAAYFKNDLDWNSGATPGSMTVWFPLGTATTADTWSGY